MGGSSSPSAEGRLTPNGVRQLFRNVEARDHIQLQVLGVYRYLVDPALVQRLDVGWDWGHDAFDLLLSDGRHKMKAVLSPALNGLVWKREIVVRSIISVRDFQVFAEDPKDSQQTHRVCVVQDVVVPQDDEGLSPKLFLRRFGGHQDGGLAFVSTTNPREVGLIPLAGERCYYLPIGSDHYTLDWACSFTDGVPEADSPLDDLEINWVGRFAGGGGKEESTRRLAISWDSTQEYCIDLFPVGNKTILRTLEVLEAVKQNGSPGPPIIGTVRVKSKLMHVGDPSVSNLFPFVFNVIIVDAMGVCEVAFYGAMCAKYFLSLQEGDLVQLRGYSAVLPPQIGYTSSTSPVFYYGPDSTGCVLHVPKKYWKFLQMANVCLPPLETRKKAGGTLRGRPTWLECSFVNTLNTLYWSKDAMNDIKTMYFDFVGVLSYVGKVYRERNQTPNEGTEVTEFRWVKVFDNSSSSELVVRLNECSQPAVFRSVEAGNTFMATKLQWVILPGDCAQDRIQYAITSVYSVLRSNEAIRPFYSLEECSLNEYFAQSIMKDAVIDSSGRNGESNLGSHIETKYRPRNRLPADVDRFKDAFSLEVLSLSEMRLMLPQIEAFGHRHFGFVGQVCNLRMENDTQIVLELRESGKTNETLVVQVYANPLYQKPIIKGRGKKLTATLPLIRVLSPSVVDVLYRKALQEKLTLSLTEECLFSEGQEYFFSLHLFREANSSVTWEVDAILSNSRP